MVDSPVKSGAGHRRTIDFESGIPFLVSALGNKISAQASNTVRDELGIGLMEWRILALLAVENEATPARIGQVAGVDKSVVSRAAASLEHRGLITVTPDPAANRQTRLAMTDAGGEMHDRGIAVSYVRNEQLLEGFTAEERELLAAFLKRVTANLANIEPKRRR